MDEILQEIEQRASSYGVFQCRECADAIEGFLISQAVSGKRIKIDLGLRDLPWSVIYDLKRNLQIATNGYHEGIVIWVDGKEIVFDNIDHAGIEKTLWLSNLTSPTIELGRGKFEVTEEVF